MDYYNNSSLRVTSIYTETSSPCIVSRDYEPLEKSNKMGKFMNPTRRRYAKIKCQLIRLVSLAVIGNRQAIIRAFTSVILALIILASIIYTSPQTVEAAGPLKQQFPFFQSHRAVNSSTALSDAYMDEDSEKLTSPGALLMNSNLTTILRQFSSRNYRTTYMGPTAETVKTGQQLQIYSAPNLSGATICYCKYPHVKQRQGRDAKLLNFHYSLDFGQLQPQMHYLPRTRFQPTPQEPYALSSQVDGPDVSSRRNFAGGHSVGWILPTGAPQGFHEVISRVHPDCTVPVHQLPNIYAWGSSNGARYEPRSTRGEEGNGWNEYQGSNIYSVEHMHCKQDERQCIDGSMCISKLKWCDERINCPDSSDELSCSCRERINEDRLCDGYFDCSHGEDELGCFGCRPDSFSCQDWSRRYRQEKCVPLRQRCDDIQQCANGRDEMECTVLTQSIADPQDVRLNNNNDSKSSICLSRQLNFQIFLTGYLTGFLYKNHKGRWYPVCTAAHQWAVDACIAESGTMTRELPKIETVVIPQARNHGPYLSITPTKNSEIVSSCKNQALFVECPPIPCGTRVLSHEYYRPYGIYEDSLVASPMNASPSSNNNSDSKGIQDFTKALHNLNRKEKGRKTLTTKISRDVNDALSALFEARNSSDARTSQYPPNKSIYDYHLNIHKLNGRTGQVGGDFRIVGGKASHPQSWPYLVAVYRDGYFLCGAVILDTQWILTAAHCVDRFKMHYYEVRVGLLRRYSYSPMSQTRRAHLIIPHSDYDRGTMRNDIALIKLNQPLRFNRWIRPICLPLGFANSEPAPQTTCVTIGWGATTENGPHPDQLREVEIPILDECKRDRDKYDGTICAGVSQGRKDACQGDSGGPLMCRVPRSQTQWYVAGIVSHGEGCGRENEPGAYTRVSKYKDWIHQTRQSFHSASQTQITTCPGFVCEGGLGKCIPLNRRCNGIVDCFNAEDEKHCQAMSTYSHNRNSQYVERLPGKLDIIETPNIVKMNSAPSTSVFHTFFEYPYDTSKYLSQHIVASTTYPVQLNHKIEPHHSSSSKPPIAAPSFTPYSDILEGLHLFQCSKIPQTILENKRCDKNIDCEDGTDEGSCTCRDLLRNNVPSALCDGHIHCYDQTDELNCDLCRDDEFTCSRSGTCIPRSQECDTIVQCPLKEDEADCFALTDNRYIIYDLDNQTYLNQEGVIARITNGVWKPICSTYDVQARVRIADNVCLYLGLKGHESVTNLTIPNQPFIVLRSIPAQVIPYEYPMHLKLSANISNTCQGLHVKCQSILTRSLESHRVEHIGNTPRNTTYLFPWETAIFVDGRYRCPGVLLEDEWVLTSYRCTKDLDLYRNYTTVVVGLSPTFQHADGPHQQVIRVNSIRIVDQKYLEAALIHLNHSVNLTRGVKPISYNKLVFPTMDSGECVALGTDNNFESMKTFTKPVGEGCPSCYRCFTSGTMERCNTSETRSWDGIVVCRGMVGWYPAAIFHDMDMLCGFRERQTLTSIAYINAHIMQSMDKLVEPVKEPECAGLRCTIGNCVPWAKICDMIDDCRDGADEVEKLCNERRERCQIFQGIECSCIKSQLNCGNGQCVEKEKFCDGVQDCRNGSDEPNTCNCGEYLRLTNPTLVCDNIRHCWDKTDENNDSCLCKDSSFQCWNKTRRNGPCIPQDFVCDGFNDCANGEDEAECRIIKGHQGDPAAVGQVFRRTLGVWRPECFPYPVETTEEAVKICRSIGYVDGVILSQTDTHKYGNAVILTYDSFFSIKLNSNQSVYMRGDRPLVNSGKPKNTCHRAFVKCSSIVST